MSSAMPVVLVSLPNLPYLLGTFDTTKFKQWWRSAPFPDELQSIKKGFHIYGRTHLAIAQRVDGLWAVYRSKNYGIDWERVFLAAPGEVIYDVVLITFGWAILNTSAGFYETVKAGATWTKISSLPGASATPAFCNIGGGDILLCTDGRYIWRSTNIARSWTLVCDMATLLHYTAYVNAEYNNIYYSGLSKPCIAGANGRVYAGHGPFLVRSDDFGSHWTGHVQYWEDYPFPAQAFLFPPGKIVWYRIWSMSRPQFIISEISIASVDGPAPDDVVFLFKADDLYPISGESNFSRVFRTVTYEIMKNYYFNAVFQQYLTADVSGQHLSSYEVAVLGANHNDRLVFSAQTKIVDGVFVPSLKYSTDGGVNWIDIDVSKIQIGDPNEGGNYGGSMLDDNFAKLTWAAPPCNNSGYYIVTEEYRRQCQSYEIDVNIEAKRAPPEQTHSSNCLVDVVVQEGDGRGYKVDAIVELAKLAERCFIDAIVEKGYWSRCLVDAVTENDQEIAESIDALAEAAIHKIYQVDAFAEGRKTRNYQIDRTLEGITKKQQHVDAVIEKDRDITETVDSIIWAFPKRCYLVGTHAQGKRRGLYLCDTILVEDGFNATVQKMIAKFPQFVDLVDPGMPYEVYDSRKVTS